jgi:diketogulonate reductase-like aldo/keto reductase
MTLEQHSKSIANLSIPPILYGTAWKEDNTDRLVVQALTLGFNGIDTANQRKHYFEEGVGFAVQKFLKTSQKNTCWFISTNKIHVHTRPRDVVVLIDSCKLSKPTLKFQTYSALL